MDHGVTPRRASEWLVALAEDPDDADLRTQFEAWLAASPANATDWAEMLRTYTVMGMTPPVYREYWEGFAVRRKPTVRSSRGAVILGISTPSAFPTSVRRSARQVRRTGARRGRRIAYGLAGAAVAVCLCLVVLPLILPALQADYVTTTAQLRTVTLADGSTVHLGPKSAIGVAFTDAGRRVRLLKGEAFFEVAHDAARPFSVEAGGVLTTDIGTAFEVRLDTDGTDVGVRDGLVRVDDPQASPPLSQQLGAGQWVRVDPDGRATRGSNSPQDIASWLQGQIVARNQPVGEVIDELRRYYSGLVIVRGEGFADQPITGVFNVADPVAALGAVARGQGASLTHPLPGVVVISAR